MSQPGLSLSLIDAFKARYSIREFGRGALDPDKLAVVTTAITTANSLPTPFGGACELSTFPPGLASGSITNEAGWIIGKVAKRGGGPAPLVDVAFRIHYALMILTQAGIGTIWISGTFSPERAEHANPGFSVPCALAYGLVPGENYLTAKADWSGSRKPENQIFAVPDPSQVIELGQHFKAALRSGPSAMNRQTWRFVFIGNLIHLYNAGSNESSNFDMGIALANIFLLAQEEGKSVAFTAIEDPPQSPIGGKYVISTRLT
jgi:nitroreductase